MQESIVTVTRWFESNGGYVHPAAEFACSDRYGIYLRHKLAEEPSIEPGATIISCPHSVTLSAIDATSSDFGLDSFINDDKKRRKIRLPEIIKRTAPRTQCLAALWLCVQLSLGEDSFWGAYVDLLPKSLEVAIDPLQGGPDLPVSWHADERSWLDGSPLASGLHDLESCWRTEYVQWSPHFGAWAQENNVDLSWQCYEWALTILTSRAFQSSLLRQTTIRASSPPQSTLATQPLLSFYNPDMLLYPGIDLLNHSPTTQNYWYTDAHSLSIICNDYLNPGDEIFNSYGPRNNGQLLLSYGFALKIDLCDTFPLKLPSQEYPLLEKIDVPTMPVSEETEPARIPEAHDPGATTFYVRDRGEPGYSNAIPGYASHGLGRLPSHRSETLHGFPLALIARLTYLLLNTRETERLRGMPAPADDSVVRRDAGPACCRVSLRVTLALVSLLLDRLSMERTRLSTGLDNLSRALPQTETSARRHRNASIYMRGQARVLDANIALLNTDITSALTYARVLQERGGEVVGVLSKNGTSSTRIYNRVAGAKGPNGMNGVLTLPLAYNLLDAEARDTFALVVNSIHDTAPSATTTYARLSARTQEDEEDLWVLFIGMVSLLSSAEPSQMGLKSWIDRISSAYEQVPMTVDEETVQHVRALVDTKRVEADHASLDEQQALRAFWEREEWSDEAHIRKCIRIVHEETVAVHLSSSDIARIEGTQEEHKVEKQKRNEERTRVVFLVVEDV